MYYDIHCRGVELSDTRTALVHEKLGLLEHQLHDYPPESVMARVTLERSPMTDEYYNVRVIVEMPGERCFARADAETLESALVQVTGELERQVKRLVSEKRNETHWKRIRHRSETVRRTVPVDEDQLPEIAEEVQQRTDEQQKGHERRAA